MSAPREPLRDRARHHREDDARFAGWAAGYGVVEHSDLTQVDHLRLDGFDPLDLDGRDPASIAWAVVRDRVLSGMEWAGIRLDPERNRTVVGERAHLLTVS